MGGGRAARESALWLGWGRSRRHLGQLVVEGAWCGSGTALGSPQDHGDGDGDGDDGRMNGTAGVSASGASGARDHEEEGGRGGGRAGTALAFEDLHAGPLAGGLELLVAGAGAVERKAARVRAAELAAQGETVGSGAGGGAGGSAVLEGAARWLGPDVRPTERTEYLRARFGGAAPTQPVPLVLASPSNGC